MAMIRSSLRSASQCWGTSLLAFLALAASASGHDTVVKPRSPAVELLVMPPRTWVDVQQETEQAMEAAQGAMRQAARDEFAAGRTPASGGGGGICLYPGTSVMEWEATRTEAGPGTPVIVVLDVRVERDYDHRSGVASSFRIYCYRAILEGELMLERGMEQFQRRKVPYQLIPRKKPPFQPEEAHRVSPVF